MQQYFSMLFILLGIHVSPGGTGNIDSLNKILTSAGSAVGTIICVVGLVKLVLSLADQNAVSKQQSSMLIGVCIFFVSMSQIVAQLNITGTKSANQMGATIINILGSMLTWGGSMLLVVAVIMLVLSIASEQADQKADASKLIGVGIGLLSISSAAKGFAGAIGSNSPTILRNLAVRFIINTTTYIGAGLMIMGIWHVVNAIREEDARERGTAVRFIMAAIGLIAIRPVLSMAGLYG